MKHLKKSMAMWGLGIVSSAVLLATATAGGGGGIGSISGGTSSSGGMGSGGSGVSVSGGGGHSGGSSSMSGSGGHSGGSVSVSGGGHSVGSVSGGHVSVGSLSGSGGRHLSGGTFVPNGAPPPSVNSFNGNVHSGNGMVPFGGHRLQLSRPGGPVAIGGSNFGNGHGTIVGVQRGPGVAFGGHAFPHTNANGSHQFLHHPVWDHGLDHLWHGHRYRWFAGGVYGGAWYICDDGFYPYGPVTADDENPIYDPPTTTVPTDDNGTPSVETQVQMALAELGYYHGEIDGYVNVGLIDAIQRYQREHQLKVTGEIDQALLDTLFEK